MMPANPPSMALAVRAVAEADVPLVAEMNKRLIDDEGSRNPMSVPELAGRLRGWLHDGWRADLFLEDGAVVGYALYLARRYEHDPSLPEIFLRQFFIERDRRGRGLGTEALSLLERERFPRPCRVELSVLEENAAGRRFWQRTGFRPHVLTLERFLR